MDNVSLWSLCLCVLRVESGYLLAFSSLPLRRQRVPQGITGTVEMLLAGAPLISLRLMAR